jgi:DNA-binding protein
MLVEVGLQGTERQTGRRPAMNVGVVLDLRSADAAAGDAACALLESLAAARDIGDRFSVVVAGREGELLVPADAFGWGAVRVACDQLFGDDADLNRGGLDLATAWDRAFDTVLSADDPTAALGSSFVWVVTPGLSSMDVSLLERRAHTASVDGVPTSVVGLGSGADTALLDRVALAGQGHRRLVGSTEEAESVVNAEISAISRVVARAVRLRIRLAPGVELVDVIGSERLDDARAEQVRQVEQAIDQRLSRNLGIEADRGEDEDGIQIVIPAFMADDHHVILLDVIVDGPGAVVDVTARYKDLVHLRNGVSRGHLSVPRGDVEPGPLALNVTRNLVAWDVAQALTLAAAQLDAGSRAAATDELRRASSLVRGLRATVPGFASDASLDADLDLLADAIATTGRAPHGDPSVARALRAAGWLKLFSGPESGDER